MKATLPLATWVSLLLFGTVVQAHSGHEEPVVITGHYNNAVGSSDAASAGVVGPGLIASRPLLRAGELLEWVPGIIVTQHSSEGKANQYFLRGFNLDHGTDFAVRVAGVPVNLPSHGHGQGYADMNFVLPELVARMDYRKGPYAAREGDFSSAGSADIHYRRSLEASFAQVHLGGQGYRRAVVASGLGHNQGLLAFEAVRADGPWTVPERLRKHAGVLMWAPQGSGHAFTLMGHQAQWTATDQIPQRAIEDGSLGRFDSLDPSDGGRTRRTAASWQWRGEGANGKRHEASAWAFSYGLNLFSNFTDRLERPATGDQFEQHDRRRAAGLRCETAWLGAEEAPVSSSFAPTLRPKLGLELRHDRARLGLYNTQTHQRLETVREDLIHITQAALWAEAQAQITERQRAVFGLRWQHQSQQVQALSLPANSGQGSAQLWLPRANWVWGPFSPAAASGQAAVDAAKTEFFAHIGRGFHSNDVRGTATRQDPRTGEAISPVPALVPGVGAELGLRSQPWPNVQTSLAMWRLRSASELVYVGDAGNTAPSGASRRQGVEWNTRLTFKQGFGAGNIHSWALDADLAWNRARTAEGLRLPNALDRVASLGLAWRGLEGWQASVQGRFRGSGALSEDNALRSRASFTTNARLAREFSQGWAGGMRLSFDVFNLLNRRSDDIEYAYESQRAGEAQPVFDRHVHAAAPRTFRLGLKLGW